MKRKKGYVVGFLFDEDKKEVVLIKKNKPEWQKGFLNGVGGKIEPGECAETAMEREFEEETSVKNHAWRLFCVMKFTDCDVHCYKAFLSKKYATVKSVTEEEVGWYPVAAVPHLKTISNIPWLIHMALDERVLKATVGGTWG